MRVRRVGCERPAPVFPRRRGADRERLRVRRFRARRPIATAPRWTVRRADGRDEKEGDRDVRDDPEVKREIAAPPSARSRVRVLHSGGTRWRARGE